MGGVIHMQKKIEKVFIFDEKYVDMFCRLLNMNK